MTQMRRGDAAQVVLLPEGEIGEAVLALAERWTSEGLIDAVYWVPASSVREHSLLPAKVSAIVMGTVDGQLVRRETSLLAALSADRLKVVIVSSVRWLAPGQDDRDEVSAAAERLLHAITASVPTGFAHQGEALSGTEVRSINIVLAATRVSSDEVRSLLSTSWQENIVVSPEARQRPGAADTYNDADDIQAWAAFIATSVASLAGLWTGMTATPIMKTAGSGIVSNVPHVRVARTFARAVVSQGFTIRLAKRVAQRLADASTLLRDPLVTSRLTQVYVLDDDETDAEITRALDFLTKADDSILRYSPLPRPGDSRARVSVWRLLADFLKFSADKIAAIPQWIAAWTSDKISARFQKALVGAETQTGITVDFREDARVSATDRDVLETAAEVRRVRDQLHARLESRKPPSLRRINAPTLWKDLRAIIFALADGGPGPTGFTPTLNAGKTSIVPDIGLLVPLPDDRWELPRDARRFLAGDEDIDISASWAGVRAAKALVHHLDETAKVAEERVEHLRVEQEKLLDACFEAERHHVMALHAAQDARSELSGLEATRELFARVQAQA